MSLRLTAETATQAWDDLAERLERFIKTWEQDQEPTLTAFLPEEPPAFRRLVLIELIKVDMEQRTTRGRGKRLENYTSQFPELLEEGEPPCDLIYEEYHIRRTAGQPVSPQDYYQRFPKSADALRRLMGTEDLSATTQLVASRRVEGLGPGQKLDDFDLLAQLGKGAFGSVFLARQVSMQRLVALKVSADKGNESQTLAALDHPNIIRVFDQRRLPERRVRLLYMQFAPGGTLADVVKEVRNTPPDLRTGTLLSAAVTQAAAVGQAFLSAGPARKGTPNNEDAAWKRRLSAAGWPETVCRLGIQLAQALDHAHKQGVLHRDVKPANVLLAADGSPKLADFNISFCSQLEGATPAAYFGGSLAYMSPEQLEACNPTHEREPQDLDGRSDLYSLAVVLWELLYGERPFAEDEMASSGWSRMLDEMTKIRRSEQPVAPLGPRDPVTVRLEQVLRKALSPDPDKRHPDGATFARELTLCLNPRAWDLVHDLTSGWRDWARRRPIMALFPVNLPPFLLASAYNYFYNEREFVANLPEESKSAFYSLAPPVNIVLFSLGIGLVLYYAWPIARAMRSLSRGEAGDLDRLRAARRRSMNLGHWIAAVGMALWLISGLIFPLGIQLMSDEFPARGYLHFLGSMVTCGLISCCFPFLATTWLSVRIFFPALLASTPPDANEQRRLVSLSRQAGYYVVAAAVVPMLASLLLPGSGLESRPFTIILIVAGIVGFIAAYLTWQRLRADLIALSIATRPADMVGTTTDTVETF
jgi:serine/threonine protein kinase